MTIRGMLIGCGPRGRHWARVLTEDDHIELVAFVDINPEVLAAMCDTYPDVPGFPSIDAALGGTAVDFAVLVTPPDGHKEQCLKLFTADLHVMAEKPLTLNISDALEVVAKARARNRKLGVSMNFRYLPVVQAYRHWIRKGRLGKPSYCLYHYAINRDGCRPGGNRYPLTLRDGMFIDQAIHHYDLMRFCFDAEIKNVTARSWNPPWSMYQSDSVVSTTFELDNGMFCVYLGSLTGGWDEMKVNWRTDCAEGILMMQEIYSDLAFARTKDAKLTEIPIAKATPYIDDTRQLLANFVKAVQGEAALECSGLDHLRTLIPTIACMESRDRGVTIDMNEFYREHGVDELWTE